MKALKTKVIIFSMLFASGCSAIDSKEAYDGAVKVISGTPTAIVGLPLDKKGAPDKKLVDLKVVLKPGQKVVFAGPEKFIIYFKGNKSPLGIERYSSSRDGVVAIKIPKDFFQKREYKDELKRTGSVVFDYGIIVDGNELDPKLIIIGDDS